jgi:hypothetical protein
MASLLGREIINVPSLLPLGAECKRPGNSEAFVWHNLCENLLQAQQPKPRSNAMGNSIREHAASALNENDVIRELCEKGVGDGADIWDTLEAQGIHATPGVICQAIAECQKHPPAAVDDAPMGLTAEDVQTLARIARKVGGLDRLRAMLGGIERMVN